MDIDVKTGKIWEKADEQKRIKDELNRINSNIQASRRRLKSCLSSSASGKIDSSLNSACNSLQNLAGRIGSMADGLGTIARLYETTEQDISGSKPSGQGVGDAGSSGSGSTVVKWTQVIVDMIKTIFKLGVALLLGNSLVDIIKILAEKLGNVIPKSSGNQSSVSWKNILSNEETPGEAKPAAGTGSNNGNSANSNGVPQAGGSAANSSGMPQAGASAANSSGMPQPGASSSSPEDWDSLVGKTVADINSNYYTSDNISYTSGYKGQCTWYAYGRFYEVTGIKLGTARNAQTWLSDNASNSQVAVTYDASTIKPKSIAVRTSGTYGHVMFVEDVTYDSNGSPQYVYFTECNADGNGVYNEGSDCIVKKLSYSDFVSQKKPAGYISAK